MKVQFVFLAVVCKYGLDALRPASYAADCGP
jgi:hypothetical protein